MYSSPSLLLLILSNSNASFFSLSSRNARRYLRKQPNHGWTIFLAVNALSRSMYPSPSFLLLILTNSNASFFSLFFRNARHYLRKQPNHGWTTFRAVNALSPSMSQAVWPTTFGIACTNSWPTWTLYPSDKSTLSSCLHSVSILGSQIVFQGDLQCSSFIYYKIV